MSRTYILKAPGAAPVAVRRMPPQRLGGPLSNEQKARLCILSNEAHDFDGPLDADEFRHEQVKLATGKPGLTACTQDDWNLLHAHFLALVGRSGEAFNAAMKHGTEPQRVAMHKLHEALRRAQLPMAYAAAICRRQYKCEPDAASPRQLWNLIFTVNNRATARRRQA